MPKGTDKPKVTNPSRSTLEAYVDRTVLITEKDERETSGRLVQVADKFLILHIRTEAGHLDPFGIMIEDVESIQEIKALRAVS